MEILTQKEVIVRIKKVNAILERPINNLFPTKYTYQGTNQTDQARKQKLRREEVEIDELKRIFYC